MTGFGRAELDLSGVRLSVEIATVNQKNLQVSVFGPEAWPALESSHAVAHGVKLAASLPKEQVVVINLSGRGDKDVWSAARAMGTEIKL